MTTIAVPAADETPWPTLGPQVCDYLERNACHGPGDLLGDRLDFRRDEELRGFFWSFYELYPRGHELGGRRRFNRAAIILGKGQRKTEAAAFTAFLELAKDAPVRFRGWSGDTPDAGDVRDPFIPMFAATEEQTEDLAYGALRAIVERCPLRGEFDVGEKRIMRKDGRGMAKPLAAAPAARDGMRLTFAHFDETHHFKSERLRRAHKFVLAGLTKRYLADAWALETSTMHAPGEMSVAESTFEYGRSVADGRHKDGGLFFFYRGADPRFDEVALKDPVNAREAVTEAYGPCAGWSDVEGKVRQFNEPDADVPLLRRLILNQPVRPTLRAFDVALWASRSRPDAHIPDGAQVTLGFNGSRRQDATALVATEILTGLQEPVGIWERPLNAPPAWETPAADVDRAVRAAWERWSVWKFYADPRGWAEQVGLWIGEFGEEATGKHARVVPYETGQAPLKWVIAVRDFCDALKTGGLTHGGTPELAAVYARHVGNAHRHLVPTRGEDEQPLWYPEKEAGDSANAINAARAGILSWDCRLAAIEDGVGRVLVGDMRVEALA